MARSTVRTAPQGRRPLPKSRTRAAQHVDTTLGELIAAAFDTIGNEVHDVARLLSSRELRKLAGRRIVLVQ